MSKRNDISRRGGFSLVEVLVVVAIIGILMGLISGALVMAKRKAERIRVATKVADLKIAWKGYRLDYRRFPPRYYPADRAEEMGPEAVGILRGDMTPDNPRGTRYLDFRPGATQYRDEWRQPFRFMFDVDGDGRVNVPGHGNIRTSIAVWSWGRDANDPDDDICSWEK
jgi:prepilin-type N-terminal cleavage/methylation domain-containing protein